MKKGKLIALIAALVVVIAGGTVGVLFAAGVFKSDSQKVLELLSQTPEKCSTALMEEIGFGELFTNIQDNGGYYTVGMKEETSGVGVEVSLQGKEEGDGRIDAKVSLPSKEVNGNVYIDSKGNKISLMLPEVVEDTAFVLDLAAILDENTDFNMDEATENAKKCEEAIKELYSDEIELLLDGMECESISDGYEVTLTEDTMDECLELFAERMKSDEINDFLKEIYAADEDMSEQWESVISEIDAMVDQGKEYTKDYTFEVYCDGSDLTGFKFPIVEGVVIEGEFSGEAENRESEISVKKGEEKVCIELKNEIEEDKCSSEINAKDITGTTVFTYKEEHEEESGDLKIEMTAEEETVTIEGKLTEVETGSNFTLSIDKISSSDVSDAINMPFSVTVSMGELDGDIEPLEAEKEEVIDSSGDFTTIVSEYATDFQEFAANFESEFETLSELFNTSDAGSYDSYDYSDTSDLDSYDYLDDSTETTDW